jgi:adenine deaminase
LTGDDLRKYVSAGISTEHEAVSLSEATEKMELGMYIMIREGSSAKNMKTLIDLAKNPETVNKCFFVSDDLHCDDLVKGHMNILLRKAVSLGVDVFDAIKMVTYNPAIFYNLPVGLLRKGDFADFVIVDDLKKFNVLETWVNGKIVAKNGKSLFKIKSMKGKNSFKLDKKNPDDFEIKSNKKSVEVNLIEIVKNQIVTRKSKAKLNVLNGNIIPDLKNDILKISVVERYGKNNLSVAFVKGFNLKYGAIASSVAHDSHNIIVVGTSDDLIAKAVNTVREMGGGLAFVDKKTFKVPLPIAGLMNNDLKINNELEKLFQYSKLKCGFNPFPTLSFLALLVIPELKISDKGLFDATKFSFIKLEIN